MIANAAPKGARYPNIKRSAIATSHDVDSGMLFEHGEIEVDFWSGCKCQSGMPAFAGMTGGGEG